MATDDGDGNDGDGDEGDNGDCDDGDDDGGDGDADDDGTGETEAHRRPDGHDGTSPAYSGSR